jgi:hypothetical protein
VKAIVGLARDSSDEETKREPFATGSKHLRLGPVIYQADGDLDLSTTNLQCNFMIDMKSVRLNA